MFLYYHPNWRDLWTCYGNADAAAAQQKYAVWWGDKWHAPIKAITYYNSSHTRIELQAAAARGLDCCWAAASRRGALCQNKEKHSIIEARENASFARTEVCSCQSDQHGLIVRNNGIALRHTLPSS